MTIFFIILGLAMFAGIIYVTTKEREIELSIDSKSGRHYRAVRVEGTNGSNSTDWLFYSGVHLLTDLILIKLLFDVIEGNDVYGDYDYYLDDEEYYRELNETTSKEVKEESTIVDAVGDNNDKASISSKVPNDTTDDYDISEIS